MQAIYSLEIDLVRLYVKSRRSGVNIKCGSIIVVFEKRTQNKKRIIARLKGYIMQRVIRFSGCMEEVTFCSINKSDIYRWVKKGAIIGPRLGKWVIKIPGFFDYCQNSDIL